MRKHVHPSVGAFLMCTNWDNWYKPNCHKSWNVDMADITSLQHPRLSVHVLQEIISDQTLTYNGVECTTGTHTSSIIMSEVPLMKQCCGYTQKKKRKLKTTLFCVFPEFQSPPLSIHHCLNEDSQTTVTCPAGHLPSVQAAYVGYSPRTSNNCPPTIYQCTVHLANLKPNCNNRTRTCVISPRLTSLSLPPLDSKWPMCTESHTTNFVHVQYFCFEGK